MNISWSANFKYAHSLMLTNKINCSRSKYTTRIPKLQTRAKLRNHDAKKKRQVTALDVVKKVTGDEYIQKENSHTAEDKIKYFIQKGIKKKFLKVGYKFNSMLPLLTEVLTKLRELNVQENANENGASKNGNLGECSFQRFV